MNIYMNLPRFLSSRLRQERPGIVFEALNGNLIHEGVLPYGVCHALLGLTPVGIGHLYKEHPFAQWELDPQQPITVEAIG